MSPHFQSNIEMTSFSVKILIINIVITEIWHCFATWFTTIEYCACVEHNSCIICICIYCSTDIPTFYTQISQKVPCCMVSGEISHLLDKFEAIFSSSTETLFSQKSPAYDISQFDWSWCVSVWTKDPGNIWTLEMALYLHIFYIGIQ